MDRQFEFNLERKKLADSLREKRKENGPEAAKETLDAAKETESYGVNKTLRRIASDLPAEFLEKAASVLEVVDDPEKWEVMDLKPFLTPEIKALIDAQILIEALYLKDGDRSGSHHVRIRNKLGVDYDVQVKKNEEFINTITKGRLLDARNFNHVVSAENDPDDEPKTFDRYSSILPSDSSYHEAFWIGTHGTPYVLEFSRPIVICTPYNPETRRFIKEEMITPADRDEDEYKSLALGSVQEFLKAFMSAQELPAAPEHRSHPEYELPFKESYAKKAKAGEGYSWMDIADCLVDLKANKMWTRKYSEAEKKEVEEDIAAYRSGRKKI